MPHRHVETERTFHPDGAVELPDLTALKAVAAVREAGSVELDATYFDTAGLDLLRAGVTLRRRAGGDDAGWHAKLPVESDSRVEVHLPLDDSLAPPEDLAGLVRGWTRAEPLVEVALITTTRRRSHLLDDAGGVLAEVAEDEVVGLRTGGEPIRWREWEVELVSGDRALLDDVTALLGEHGVAPSAVQRKIAVVLGATTSPPALEEPARDAPARLLVHRRLLSQVAALAAADPLARQGDAVGVHHARRAARRLRALLATYQPLVEREETDPVREELRWLARALGAARDEEMVHARLEELVAALPLELVRGPVLARIRRHHDAHEASELAEVHEVLDSQRYFHLRAALDDLAASPPWTTRAERRASKVLPRLVAREQKRLRRRHRAAGDAGDPHAFRKAAKRLRYAYEVPAPVWGREAKAPRRAAKALTEVLGRRQDDVVVRAVLLELADEAWGAREETFTYGLLHAELGAREAAHLARADEAWARVVDLSW